MHFICIYHGRTSKWNMRWNSMEQIVKGEWLKVLYVGIEDYDYNENMFSENRILFYKYRFMRWSGWYTNYSIFFRIKRTLELDFP